MKKTGKKVLITGAAGFIGSHLTKALTPFYDMVGFDIVYSVFQNVTQKDMVLDFFAKERPDIVFHLAANPDVSKSVIYPQEDLFLSAVGTLNVLEACRKYPVELMFLSSSAIVYGEMEAAAFSESSPLKPTTPYGIGKITAEQYCNLYFRRYQVPTVVFRFFNMFGPRQLRSFAIPNMIARIKEAKDSLEMFGTEGDTRDFTYVEDLCEAFRLAIEKKPVGMTLNVASGKDVPVIDIAKIIAKHLGKDLRFYYKQNSGKDNVRVTRLLGDNSLIRKTLGWAPKFSLDEGLKRTVQSFV